MEIGPHTNNELKITNHGTTKAGRSNGVLKEIHIDVENRKQKKLAEIKQNLDNLPNKKTKVAFSEKSEGENIKDKKLKPVETPIETNQDDDNSTYLKLVRN